MAGTAKHFIVVKGRGERKEEILGPVAESVSEIKKDFKEDGYDLSDILVLNPQEYQQYEIEKSRREHIESENPILSKIFPSTAERMAKTGEEPPLFSQAAFEDGQSLLGRTAGAGLDAYFNKKDGESAGDAFWRSIGLRQGEDNGRSAAGDFAQNIIRDPMLAIGMAIPAAKIPGVAGLATKGTSLGGKFAARSLAKPALEGFIPSAIVEAARPVLTEREFDLGDAAANSAIGAGLGAGAHNVLGLGKLGAAGVKSLAKKKSAKLDAHNWLDTYGNAPPEKILADLEAKYKVDLNDAIPPVRQNAKQNSVYDIVSDLLLSRDLPPDVLAEFLGNANHMPSNALLEAARPEGLAKIKAAYRSQPELAGKILEDLEIANLVGNESEIWKRHLENAAQSGRRLKSDKVLDILDAPLMEAKGSELGIFDTDVPMLKRLESYAEKLRGESGPKEITPKDMDILRRRLGDIDWDKIVDKEVVRTEKETMKKAYRAARDELMMDAIMSGDKEAVEAYKRMADNLEFRDALLDVLGAGTNKFNQKTKIAAALKNRASGESNSPKNQELYELIQNLSERTGKDYAGQAKLAYYADQLSPKGDVFEIPNYNPSFTGKGYEASIAEAAAKGKTSKSALAKVAEAKAKALAKAKEPKIVYTLGEGDFVQSVLNRPSRYYGNPYGGSKERERQIDILAQELLK